MFDRIIHWSLSHRPAVLFVAVLVSLGGIWAFLTMKVDILPDINRPIVTVFAQSEGFAAEDVERYILTPLESTVAGAPGVERVRGTASPGLAIVNVEFSWGSDIFRNRQIIQERIARTSLPSGVTPVLGPVGSIMGEVLWAGLTSEDPRLDAMQLRTLADWTIRPVLLRIPGVSDVLVMGGDVREWQINLNAEQMKRYGLVIEDIAMAVQPSLTNKSGGILVQGGREYPLRVLLTPSDVSSLRELAIGTADGRPLRLEDVASVVEGPSVIRGNATIDGKTGVVLRILKQPDAETLKVTAAVDEALKSLKPSLPASVNLQGDLFRQEWFINAGLNNVMGALRDGTLLVIVVLILFLMNVRTTAITLTAIPLSIFVTALVFKAFGLSVNVMTLGGLAVAIGELVDDAIVDVENVFRRLREWKASGMTQPVQAVVFKASSEIRNSIVYATILVAIVFLPVFFLPGVEGRLLASLGAAYLISLIASLVVSLTVTPVLCSLLLGSQFGAEHNKETRFVHWLKQRLTPAIDWSIVHVRIMMISLVIALIGAAGLYVAAGKEGIPPFNEGSATVLVLTPVGTDVTTSNTYASKVEAAIRKVSGVVRVSHITGRAGLDAHESGANQSEMQIVFEPGSERRRSELFREIQNVLNQFGDAEFSLGQPITHRVEMLLSGIQAPIVIKVYGDNPDDMQEAAERVVAQLQRTPGVKNPLIQKDVSVPEFRINVDRNRLAEYGLSAGTVAEEVSMGLMGDVVGQVRLGPAAVNVVVRYDAQSKGNAASIRDLPLPFAGAESVGSIADIGVESGRNRYSHESGKRVLVVRANYQGSNIVGAVESVKQKMESEQLPVGTTLSFEGTYKSQKENSRRLAILFGLGLVSIFLVLYRSFRSIPLVLQIMVNIPTALVGGIIAVWLTGGVLNLAHLIGFVSLAGIVSRNGIMLIGRCLQLIRSEGEEFSPVTIRRATLDRVVPVLMTSLVTALALIPLMLAGGEPGKELLHPLAVVIFGGLITSTIISLFLTPSLFYRFGRQSSLTKTAEVTGF